VANAAGFIQEAIWRDPDWRKLSRGAQALYMQLLSQKDIDCAGLLPLQPEKWATGCDELTVEQVWEQLGELQTTRFVFYDVDTYETLVRSYVRRSPNVLKVPNMWKSAQRCALLAASQILRDVLAAEFVSSGNQFLVAAAVELNPSLTLPEPLPNPSVRVSEPCSVSVSERVSHLSSTKGGEDRRPNCSKHPNGNPTDAPCRGCKTVREYDEKQAADANADDLVERRRLKEQRDACTMCDENGLVETRLGMARCDHQAAAHG
jgi:hypothetical protein